MAVIFSTTDQGVRYEIRTHGRSVRLYTNNVLHTQYHPQKRLSRGVWDLLALPALGLDNVRNVLLLGVGGGAAIHLLRHWCPQARITGVELNPLHLQLAVQYFDLEDDQLDLVEGDAHDYVMQYRGERFDLVIEDLFGGNDGQPDRSFAADAGWCRALGKLVNRQGALVMNTLGRSQLKSTAFITDPAIRRLWQSHLCLTLPAYENHVGAFYRQPLRAIELRRKIRQDRVRAKQEDMGLLRYRITSLVNT